MKKQSSRLVFYMVSSLFFTRRQMRKPPAKLAADRASDFDLFKGIIFDDLDACDGNVCFWLVASVGFGRSNFIDDLHSLNDLSKDSVTTIQTRISTIFVGFDDFVWIFISS